MNFLLQLNLGPALYAIVTALAIAFIWLWFWLKEDEHPEPIRLLIVAFIAGMVAIPAALFAECSISSLLFDKPCDQVSSLDIELLSTSSQFFLVSSFAFAEEFMKYIFIVIFIFWRKEYDEPADAMIYLVTGALGFAAVENVLYLVSPFGDAIAHGFTTASLRFLGPTLLHVLSSALLGYFIASTFCRRLFRKEVAIVVGLLAATLLHALFNISILVTGGERIEPALLLLIFAGVFILFAFERIKHRIKYILCLKTDDPSSRD
jgi:protease PrsW